MFSHRTLVYIRRSEPDRHLRRVAKRILPQRLKRYRQFRSPRASHAILWPMLTRTEIAARWRAQLRFWPVLGPRSAKGRHFGTSFRGRLPPAAHDCARRRPRLGPILSPANSSGRIASSRAASFSRVQNFQNARCGIQPAWPHDGQHVIPSSETRNGRGFPRSMTPSSTQVRVTFLDAPEQGTGRGAGGGLRAMGRSQRRRQHSCRSSSARCCSCMLACGLGKRARLT